MLKNMVGFKVTIFLSLFYMYYDLLFGVFYAYFFKNSIAFKAYFFSALLAYYLYLFSNFYGCPIIYNVLLSYATIHL